MTLDDLQGSKIRIILFDVKYVKNGNSYDVGPMGFTLNNLERLNVKVTNGPVTAIGMLGYTPVGITGVLVVFIHFSSYQTDRKHASLSSKCDNLSN